jgi:hypothetical protein
MNPRLRGNNGPKSAFADSLEGLGASSEAGVSPPTGSGSTTARPAHPTLGRESAKADFGQLLPRIPFALPRPAV